MVVSSSVLTKYASTGNVTSSGALVVGAAVPTGTVLLVALEAGAASVTTGVSDSKGNTWTLVATVSSSIGAAMTGAVWRCSVATALTSTDTITATRTTSGGLVVIIHAITGADPAAPVASYVTAAAASVSDPSATAITVPTDGRGFAAIGYPNNTTITPGTGWTAADASVASGSGNPRALATWTAAPGSVTPAGDLASNAAWTVIAIALAPAPAGNAAPVASAGADQIVRVGASVSFTGSATDADGTISTWAWTFGDGGTAATQNASHAYTATGAYTATLTATDNGGATGSDTATVTVLASPTIAIIGDSLTARADGNTGDRESLTRSRLVTAGFDSASVYWHGVGGKKFEAADTGGTTTAQNITEARTLLGTVDRWLIALGTNNTGDGTTLFESRLRAVLDLIYAGGATDSCIVIGLSFFSPVNTNALTYNPIMVAVVADYPYARFADWNAVIHAPHDDADWIYPADSTHMTPQGYARRDAFYVAALQNARAGGSVATVAVAAAGAGNRRGRGSSAASVGVVAPSSGRKDGSGSAIASVVAASFGSGGKQIAGAALVEVLVTSSGGGRVPPPPGPPLPGTLTMTPVGPQSTLVAAAPTLTLEAL